MLFLALTVLSILFRIPPLVNAAGVHSDAAIVGLQALHILRGEWSWFLWGAPYQGSIDALMVAIGFLVGGPTPLTLMLVPLAGHLLLTWFAFDLLSKRLERWSAFLVVLPLVFAPQAINGVALYAPRQWSITLVFAGIWLLDGAQESARPLLRYGLGAALGPLAVYLDLFALQLMVGFIAFAAACGLDGGTTPLRVRLERLAACASGLAIGFICFWLVHRLHGEVPSHGALSLSNIGRNAHLFWAQCLPWAISSKAFLAETFGFWQPPRIVELIQICGAIVLLAGILLGGMALTARRLPWKVRRLGFLGFSVAASSMAGFLLSGAPYDLGAVRYLAPIVWFSPFALSPAAHLLRPARFAFGMAPYLVSASIAGWVAYGSYVKGLVPQLHARRIARAEAQLGAVLRQKGIRYAAADYWVSYRLSFLFGEDPIVVPLGGDRYPPYRVAFEAAPVVAYLLRPSDPRAASIEYQLHAAKARYERLEMAEFIVLVIPRSL